VTDRPKRPTRQDRGYDAEYDRARAAVALDVAAGRAHCWRCGTWIAPRSRWHLGHDDWAKDANGKRIINGPECAPCNLRAAGKKAALLRRLRNKPKPPTTRVTRLEW
jgi:hypothetical protein